MDSISRLRDNAFLVRRTQTARPSRFFGKIVRPMRGKKNVCLEIKQSQEIFRNFLQVRQSAVHISAKKVTDFSENVENIFQRPENSPKILRVIQNSANVAFGAVQEECKYCGF